MSHPATIAVWLTLGCAVLLLACQDSPSGDREGGADSAGDGGGQPASDGGDPGDSGSEAGGGDGAADGAPGDGAQPGEDTSPQDTAGNDVPGEDSGGVDLGPGQDASGSDPDLDQSDGVGATDNDAGVPIEVDNSTLTGKLMMGYQGWFGAAGDDSPLNNWRHWSPGVTPAADNVTFDAWPDLREYPAAALFATTFEYADGRPAPLFSSYMAETANLHFEWMQDYGIDGVFLQQFVSELAAGSAPRLVRDQVQENAFAAAEATGRVVVVMYDISGSSESTWVATIQEHWQAVVDDGLTDSDAYLHHQGRPLVAVWGPGFTDRPGTPAQTQALIDWFHDDADPEYRATVMGGVPSRWRNLDGDSQSNTDWTGVYLSYDILSPWTVGRYNDDAGVAAFRADRVAPDMAACNAAGVEYLPVVWPGFSWSNLFDGQPLNQIPRRGGRFFWKQVFEFVNAGADMLFVAMFDEVDEGTAMFKIAETAAMLPTTGSFLDLDADGEAIPSDFYLQLAGAAGQVLRGDRTLTSTRPITPGLPTCNPPHTELVEDRCVPSCGAAGGDSCDPGVCSSHPHLESYDCEVCCNTGG